MRKRLELLLLFCCLLTQAKSQNLHLSGVVVDAQSNEAIIGANVYLSSRAHGTVTDNNGYFNMVLSPMDTLCFSFIGYRDTCFVVRNGLDKMLKIKLVSVAEMLGVVEIRAEKFDKPSFGKINLTSKSIDQMPTIGSRPDIIKAAQQMPSIEPMTEASSTILVRGGSPGENLYLLDGVPLIYVNHVGGFMSVFNPVMINSMDVYKGGFPSRFGGKLSSVVELTTKKGDPTRFQGTLSAGLTDLAFSLEGSGGLENSSFIITGRKTLFDLLFLGGTALAKEFGNYGNLITYGFHDVHGKYSWSPNAKNSFSLSFYEGDDYFGTWRNNSNQTGIEKNSSLHAWGNVLGSTNWNCALSSKLFMSNTISFSKYHLKNRQQAFISPEIDTNSFFQKGKSSVSDLSLRSHWKYSMLRNWTLEYGFQSSLLSYQPNNFYNSFTLNESADDVFKVFDESLYLDNVFKIGKVVEGSLGVRLNYFVNGSFSNLSVEPRLNLNFEAGKNCYNLMAMRVTQNAHLLMTAGSIMNNEIWIPAEANIKPSYSDQASFGWQRVFLQNKVDVEANVYYKKLSNLSAYRDGYYSLFGDSDWRNKVESGGSGVSYGFELLAKCDFGQWNGSLGYVYSHTTRQFDNINRGDVYVYEYDRPNSINANANCVLNEKWSFSALWTYQTGLPYTPVIGLQDALSFDEESGVILDEVLVYGSRNSARMRDYHRLDVAARMKTKTERGRKAEWTFSIYNLYCRQNPYYYYYGDRKGNPLNWDEFENEKPHLWQKAFFPIIPSFSYKVWF
jgi:Outer membrane receptor proteins, mostly Fe transport